MAHPGPLSGIRVLDMSRLLPGPFASQILRDLGAEVIKIEDTAGGDYVRYGEPLLPDDNSAGFHALNRGKKSAVLDLKRKEGREAFLKLVATSDVVLESFRPGVLDRLQIGPQQLLSLFPTLIVCSISGYGQTGPDRLRAGHDLNYLARAGLLGISREPHVLPTQVADLAGGAMPAVIQILAALRRKEREGKGSIIGMGRKTGMGPRASHVCSYCADVSMTDNAYSLLALPLSRHSASGEGIGNGVDWLAGSIPCYSIYRTKDGFYSVGALEPKFWKPLCEAVGKPELIDKQMLNVYTPEGAAAKAALQAVFESKTTAEWAAFFADKDVCVEPVLRPEGVSRQDRQLASRGLDLKVTVGDKTLDLPKTPLRMTGVQFAAEPGPGIGKHTEELLRAADADPRVAKLRAKL